MDIDGDDMFSSWNVLEVKIQVKNGSLRIGKSEYLYLAFAPSSGILILRGRMNEINNALQSLIYQGNQNFNGHDSMIVTVDDFGLPGYEIPALSFTRHIRINVSSSNDALIVIRPEAVDGVLTAIEDVIGFIGAECSQNKSQFLEEGTVYSYVISCDNIIIQDPDIIINGGNNSTLPFNDNMTVIIGCQKGTINLPYTEQPRVSALESIRNKTFARTWTLAGNLVDINAALSSIIYVGDQNFNSVDGEIEEIMIIAKDNLGSVTRTSLAVYVKPMDDAPVITVEGEQLHQTMKTGDGMSFVRVQCDPLIVTEDELHKLDISVRDVDNEGFAEVDILTSLGNVMIE
eukprot:5560136-Ditylum_brightwellii.AAC.1